MRGEDGQQRPVCCFVQPLQLGRLVAGPQEAARFVSLLAPREEATLTPPGMSDASAAACSECCCELHTILSAGMASKVGTIVECACVCQRDGDSDHTHLGLFKHGTGKMYVWLYK